MVSSGWCISVFRGNDGSLLAFIFLFKAPGTQNATAGSSARDDLGGPKTTNREKAKVSSWCVFTVR